MALGRGLCGLRDSLRDSWLGGAVRRAGEVGVEHPGRLGLVPGIRWPYLSRVMAMFAWPM